jgi:hypothetical protein
VTGLIPSPSLHPNLERTRMARLLTPADAATDLKTLRRELVIQDLHRGRIEDYIYMRSIDAAIEAARREGFTEPEIEIIAAQARRDVADLLAECRAEGLDAELMGHDYRGGLPHA